MYELTINDLKIGVFKTLRAARAYEPTMVDAMAADIDPLNGNYTRIIKQVRTPTKSFSPRQPSLKSNHESL
jgi:hypothetical protein